MAVGNDGQQRQARDLSIASSAVEKGRELLDSTLGAAREQATSYVDQRKDEVAQTIADFAGSLRQACEQFDDRPQIRGLVDGAANSIDEIAESIRARSFNEIFDYAEDMIRERPGTVAAATLALGFLVARFIKASAENIREQEAARHRTSGRPRGQGQRRARAQASPGSSYARSRS
jgi:ElaB/YqjD/DUF883 family membrane-anchored ribosome-binding protein